MVQKHPYYPSSEYTCDVLYKMICPEQWILGKCCMEEEKIQ